MRAYGGEKMAKAKTKAKKVKIPENIIDYYAVYALDRKLDAQAIKKKLRSIQGDIRENMSSGSLNSDEVMAKLQESFVQVADALKVFKNKETKEEYDAQLDAAYANGVLNTEAQSMAEDLYAEIEAMFMKGNYQGAAKKCTDALNSNVRDARIYGLLARSYYALQDIARSLQTVVEGIKIHPENLELLRIGARFSNEGKDDYNMAQEYINRMFSIDANNKFAYAEQIYLYLCTGKNDLAYQNIDEYLQGNPHDNEFRRTCAYDLIGFSYNYYTKDENSGSYVLISKEAYENCVAVCDKAASLYNDENIVNCLNTAKSYGEIEFNEDNKENIKWTAIAGIVYLGVSLMVMWEGFGEENMITFIGATFLIFALGVGALYCAYELYQVSKRPYWQIYKYYLTGQREKKEKIFIIIGTILAGYMKFTLKFAKWMLKFCMRLALG